jgi:hypothetical protein
VNLLLVILTVLEVVILVAVLAIYLISVERRLGSISKILGKVAFGVRAVNTQTSTVGPSVTKLNSTLREIEAALGPLAEKAKRAVRGY